MGAPYNFTVDAGADYSNTFIWYQSDGVTPKDLSGCSALMTFKDSNGNQLFQLSSSGSTTGSIDLGGATGIVTYNIGRSVTATLPQDGQQIDYDFPFLFPTNLVRRPLQGFAMCNPMVTPLIA